MKRLRISIIDLIHNSPSQSLYRRVMFSNYISIMPQIIGVWCREEGHVVNYSIFTGSQKLSDLIDDQSDLVFISSFTYSAQLAYALSNYFRSRGFATVLGGPHARCYPEDACKYFDYVLGLTDKNLLKELLKTYEINKNQGTYLTANSQPLTIPNVRERWEFIKKVHQQFSIIKVVPMIGSFGCPYNCEFCCDSEIPYQSLDMKVIKEDLRFLIKKMRHPIVAWYDPNFGIKFNSIMETIESVVSPGSIDFIAECSLSILNETKVKRLSNNGFKMLMPGIESWFDYGKKSRTGSSIGMEKVNKVAEQVNMIQRYIPQVQTNFLFGLDSDIGPDPFTLTKRFIDYAPAAYPSYALLSIYGSGIKNNIKYELEDRIIPFPFHLMRSVHTLNIIPKHYSWEEFYIRFIDLLKYSFSNKAMYRRFNANHMAAPKWITLLLSLIIGGSGKIRYLSAMMRNLRKYPDFQSFVKKETNCVPAFMIKNVKKDLGQLWEWLPDKSLSYDPNISLSV
ncbi:B12-binding domain-containing radical SAM protein [Bacteroidota bacterium]